MLEALERVGGCPGFGRMLACEAADLLGRSALFPTEFRGYTYSRRGNELLEQACEIPRRATAHLARAVFPE